MAWVKPGGKLIDFGGYNKTLYAGENNYKNGPGTGPNRKSKPKPRPAGGGAVSGNSGGGLMGANKQLKRLEAERRIKEMHQNGVSATPK